MFRILRQKSGELQGLETQISSQGPLVTAAFVEGNALLSRMRALTVEQGPVEARSVEFSEQAVQLAGIITRLRQLSVASLVERAAQDLAASVVLPELDGRTQSNRDDQSATITSVLDVLGQRADTLQQAAAVVVAMPPPPESTYTPISAADAVILYARNFIPSWAGAIAIDLLPAVLVLIVAITQGLIRQGREGAPIEDTMTIAELRAALGAARDVDRALMAPTGALGGEGSAGAAYPHSREGLAFANSNGGTSAGPADPPAKGDGASTFDPKGKAHKPDGPKT